MTDTAGHFPPEILNPEGGFPGLVVVDHAGGALPAAFPLDLPPALRDTHHFRDLGVEALARLMAARLDVPVVLAPVSRLVLDLNRWLEDPRSIPARAEGLAIPGNNDLDAGARAARAEAIFWPYHAAVGRAWARAEARHADPVFFSLHSCTRHFDGARRDWDGGTIWNESPRLAHALLDMLDGQGLVLGDNQPYSGRSGLFTVDYHTHGAGQLACGFEVTNDLLERAADREAWADRLVAALSQVASSGAIA